MIRINEHYLKLQSSYLFVNISRKVSEFQKAHPEQEIIRMGIGDVTKPLPRACIEAFHRAVDEMAAEQTFRGYGPEQGYEFLREKIAEADYLLRSADIKADEIFVSDGSKCDCGNIQEIFSQTARVAIPDPVYPVYLDTNVMAGRSGEAKDGRYADIVYLDCVAQNSFIPGLPAQEVDLIYLCFPNNPTGATASREELSRWVNYAKEIKAIILFDAAYVAFIRDNSIPQSIFEIEGARDVAIEFRSFSKTAGFTGTRCAYTVIPKELKAYDELGEARSVHALWQRRHTTKFNGVSYPVQRAAEAVYSEEGKRQVRELSDYYLANARMIREQMERLGFLCAGGENAPYVWVQTNMDSWQFFDLLLEKAAVVCTPGAGFGRCGEGYVRFSAFNSRENVEKGLGRVAELF